MKHKISWIVVMSLALSACSVELKDKKKEEPESLKVLSVNKMKVDRKMLLQEDLLIEVDELELTSEAVIITESKNLTIIAGKILSQGGVIKNFESGQKAATEQNGRSGGAINISAKNAVGLLSIELKGEAGGDGRPGIRLVSYAGGVSRTPLVFLCSGTSAGSGGKAGLLNLDLLASHEVDIKISNENSSGGLGGKKGGVPAGTANANRNCKEFNDGANGLQGEKGTVCAKMSAEDTIHCE